MAQKTARIEELKAEIQKDEAMFNEWIATIRRMNQGGKAPKEMFKMFTLCLALDKTIAREKEEMKALEAQK